ncbi:MAG: hypothetical protein Q9207_006509 [Kuettlingeria erythrocarpa]
MAATKVLYANESEAGKRHELPIEKNTIRASDLAKIQISGGQISTGLRIVDNSLAHTAVGSSRITFLDSQNGRLYYRGYSICGVLGNKTYEEACFCLIWGDFPTPGQARRFQRSLFASLGQLPILIHDVIQKFPRNAAPITMFQGGLAAALAAQSDTIPAFIGKDIYSNDMGVVDASIVRTLATAQLLFAAIYCHRQNQARAEPDPEGSFASNLLLMMHFVDEKTGKPDPKYVRWIEKILLIYADHEMSCATFVFVTAASARSDPLSCYLAAVSALYGIIHGGAVDAAHTMLQRVGDVDGIPRLLAAVKDRKELLYGYGHRIYKARDPRAAELLAILKEVRAETDSDDPLFSVAEEIDRLASEDPFFQERGVRINADFYLNFACKAM